MTIRPVMRANLMLLVVFIYAFLFDILFLVFLNLLLNIEFPPIEIKQIFFSSEHEKQIVNSFNILDLSIDCFPNIPFTGIIYVDCSQYWPIYLISMNFNLTTRQ